MDTIAFSPQHHRPHLLHAMPTTPSVRLWRVRWLYAVVAGHLLVGLVLTWAGDADVFETYHRSVEHVFWPDNAVWRHGAKHGAVGAARPCFVHPHPRLDPRVGGQHATNRY